MNAEGVENGNVALEEAKSSKVDGQGPKSPPDLNQSPLNV